MPSLFEPSSRTVSGAVAEIAGAAGASADTEMMVRAGISLGASIKYFNGKVKWRWLQTDASPIQVFAPFQITGVSASAGQASAAVPASHGIKIDDWLQGSGLIVGTRVSATAAGSIGFNTLVSASIGTGTQVITVTANRDFYDLPTDWKSAYSVKLYVQQRTLKQANRRINDRSGNQEFRSYAPQGYDTFGVGAKGKIKLLPSPDAADILQLSYYRRMTVATASGSNATLDIPEEYDDYFIAFAKWHFLTDKDDAGQRGQTWLSMAKEGLTTMLADQNMQPDEDLMFSPGHTTSWPGTNDPRFGNNENW